MNHKFKKYNKNIEKSIEYHNAYKKLIKPKDCYFNVWRIVTNTNFIKNNANIRIALGYVNIYQIDNETTLYGGHAFFIDENDLVIDVTLTKDSQDTYYSLIEFDNVSDYINTVTDCTYPSLMNYLPYKKLKNEFTQYGIENDIIAIN